MMLLESLVAVYVNPTNGLIVSTEVSEGLFFSRLPSVENEVSVYLRGQNTWVKLNDIGTHIQMSRFLWKTFILEKDWLLIIK